ncbi:hypothetical protein TIFTF001_034665 [Ficus carica]|uniref:Uncharacterized protein n=1 Tax=Ficus carica TaxID=3494 RepID=A0AA88J9C8_FICCA|nr:hypothetical protein TIFTF001_034665 [Ficus carica]
MLNSMVHGLSWNWTGRPNHFMVTRHGKKPTGNYVMQDCGVMALQTVKCGMDTATSFEKYVL